MRGIPIPKKIRDEIKARSRDVCEARLPGCFREASEIHHKKSRARGGSNNPINLLHVCSSCHRKITDHFPGTGRFRTKSRQAEGQTEEAWDRESSMKCVYAHHEDVGIETGKCAVHVGTDLRCGPMYHKACVYCDPHLLRLCRICGVEVLECCC